ncbi:hypothetical protein H7J87_11280 [Mycolicibacterium wolinskyi]|uniref:Uncharacterized protein n=1 Tax=Mycolicibacterium wolinskyi TaxID=59750 RepID=A0A1X2EVH8_9MYCO|nr:MULTISPECIES: hypothetical protein [Mycolicibacterium]MCV7285911.1 hypothetical protein [Mycolicibacterium wolinskyi]MCV7297182.1 hypothetical protein [Mycolicibacterium goodii]ORX10135.1 hypothetical protein AWC31_08145 [Mycolicibacterium wolinskyi]
MRFNVTPGEHYDLGVGPTIVGATAPEFSLCDGSRLGIVAWASAGDLDMAAFRQTATADSAD